MEISVFNILNLTISLGTLFVIVKYTAITARIARAAQEQVEASHKPVIVLQFVARGSDVEQVFEKIGMGIVPQAMALHLDRDGKFIIKNIGSGPALNVEYMLHLRSEHDPKDPHSHPRKLPYLAPLDTMPGPVSNATLGLNTYRFVANYVSLSGKTYQTVMEISDGILEQAGRFDRFLQSEQLLLITQSGQQVREVLRTHRANVIGHEQHPSLATSLGESFRLEKSAKIFGKLFRSRSPLTRASKSWKCRPVLRRGWDP